MNQGVEHASQFFGAYFHQDCLVDDPNWESIVQWFKESEPYEAVRATRLELISLLAVSSDSGLECFLFDPPCRSFYDPRPAGLTIRAWLQNIVHLLAGGSPSLQDPSVSWARGAAASIAREVIAGTKDVLVGARELASLRYTLEIPEDDPDFACFVLIDSETDHLPLGPVRSLWAPDALREKDIQIARSLEWAREVGRHAFKNVAIRFGSTA